MNKSVSLTTIIRGTLIFGILLSVVQYVINRSLWLDEAYLSLNILDRSYVELLKPLEHKQVAPILFLYIEKTILQVLSSYPDYALRLFPLLSYILSLMIFYKVISIVLKNEYSRLLALSLLIFNPLFIYYSSEIKQYSTDVLLSISAVYIILRHYDNDKNFYVTLGLFGLLAIFLSNIAPIILFISVFFLFLNKFSSLRTHYKLPFIFICIWAFAFIAYYYSFIYNHPHRNGMIEEWTYYEGFMPINPLKKAFYEYLIKKTVVISSLVFGSGIYGLLTFIFLILAGCWNLIQNKKLRLVIRLLVPIITHFLLSGFKLYPIGPRLLLYTMPSLIILISLGFELIIEIIFEDLQIHKFRILSFIILFSAFNLLLYNNYPIRKNEIKETLRYLNKKMQINDKIYVNYLSSFPFKYYYKTNKINVNPESIIYGVKTHYWRDRVGWSADTLLYQKDLSLLKGRTWIIFTKVGDEYQKLDYLKKYYLSNSLRLIDHYQSKYSEAYLYEF